MHFLFVIRNTLISLASNGFESDNYAGTGEPATAPNNGLPLTAPIFANVSNFVTSGTPSNAAIKGSWSLPVCDALTKKYFNQYF